MQPAGSSSAAACQPAAAGLTATGSSRSSQQARRRAQRQARTSSIRTHSRILGHSRNLSRPPSLPRRLPRRRRELLPSQPHEQSLDRHFPDCQCRRPRCTCSSHRRRKCHCTPFRCRIGSRKSTDNARRCSMPEAVPSSRPPYSWLQRAGRSRMWHPSRWSSCTGSSRPLRRYQRMRCRRRIVPWIRSGNLRRSSRR